MKFLYIFIGLTCIVLPAMADSLQIPFDCYPKQLQKAFEVYNLKLDLDGNDRTHHSWGFLRNEGDKFFIYTYKPITRKELDLVMKIIMEIEDDDAEYVSFPVFTDYAKEDVIEDIKESHSLYDKTYKEK